MLNQLIESIDKQGEVRFFKKIGKKEVFKLGVHMVGYNEYLIEFENDKQRELVTENYIREVLSLYGIDKKGAIKEYRTLADRQEIIYK